MKAVVNRGELAHGLNRIFQVANNKGTIPVLANVLMVTEGVGTMRLAATDLNVGMVGLVPASVSHGGATTLPAKTLHNIVKNLPDGDVSLSVDENQWADIRCGRVHYRIAGIPAEDFPSLPIVADVEFLSFDHDVFSRLITQTYFSAATDEGRPHLNGIFLELDCDTIRMVGTDGRRLSYAESVVTEMNQDLSMLVPLDAINNVRKKMLSDGESDIDVGVSDSHVFFRRFLPGDSPLIEKPFVLSAKLTEAKFPPYAKVIPKSHTKEVFVNRTLLFDALRRASVINSNKSQPIIFLVQSGKMRVSADNYQVGEAVEEIDVTYNGDAIEIRMNASYIREFVSILDCENLVFHLNGAEDALVIKSADVDGFIGVIMPMRLE